MGINPHSQSFAMCMDEAQGMFISCFSLAKKGKLPAGLADELAAPADISA